MARRETAPYVSQDVNDISTMVQGLEAHLGNKGGKGGFSCKKNIFAVEGSDTQVTSWRMQDWDYKKPNLPTYARGLFTTKNSKGKPEIVVRGYDKFFNCGEVRKTEWRNVEQYTRGPYELSVKENGCIIFISGLEDGTLLVCSKHSTGARQDTDISHAVAGEEWVDKHLATVGKTRQDLAKKLRQLNATAVAELCDDEFEEHVLAYTPDAAGLYLHGINLNLPEFVTYPGHLVDSFAVEWGFKKTMHVLEDDISTVKTFLDKVAETGNYDGRDTEGFVIRCQARETKDSPWEDWFFKYKFEEPYLMYRQWRECTKAIVAGREPKYKKHKEITKQYLDFARRKLFENPSLGAAYNQNHGIIKMRDDFLAETGLKGSDIIRQELTSGGPGDGKVNRDVVLAPVATIGCGKTTVAVALTKLFDWGHLQNDNIQGKQRPQRFATGVINGLSQHAVMIADRNNHQRRERKQLIDDVSKVVTNVHFVALNYVHERGDYDRIREKTRERVLTRGDNHQTIQAGSKGQQEIVSIMEGFLHRFEPVDPERDPDDGFDKVIDLDVTASSRENLETVVTTLYATYPDLFSENMPSADDLDAAIEAALNDYKPDIKHEINSRDSKGKHGNDRNAFGKHGDGPASQKNGTTPSQSKQKEKPVEYFSVDLPVQRIKQILEAEFNGADEQKAAMYRHLKDKNRIQSEFHVTLIHRASQKQHEDYWSELLDVRSKAQQGSNGVRSQKLMLEPEMGKCKVVLERLVWDARIMCFVVRLVPVERAEISASWRTVNETAHVTVGTSSPAVKPKESNDLLKRWLNGGSGGQTGIEECVVTDRIEVYGVVKAVLSR